MATQSITANIDQVPGKTWEGMRSVPSRMADVRRADDGSRAKQGPNERSSAERVRQAIARSEQDAKLVNFYLNWWPFDLLRALSNWLQCWGCAFAVKLGNRPAPNPNVRGSR